MNALETRFSRKFPAAAPAHFSTAGRGGVSVGFETVRAGDSYKWDGLRRGGEVKNPQWLFQYTLSGGGTFKAAGAGQPVPPGSAFCAKIPSRHLYEADAACPKWTFFWIMVSNPYVVTRLLKHPNLVNATAALPENSPPVRAATDLFFELADSADTYDLEGALFHWMLEMERWAFVSRHPAKAREHLLGFARFHVKNRMAEFVPVGELADACRMSRSNFSHHFRKVTGLTPAAFIRQIRLREAVQLLSRKKLSVKEVAACTGFADANHLCKSFRRHLQISPGMLR